MHVMDLRGRNARYHPLSGPVYMRQIYLPYQPPLGAVYMRQIHLPIIGEQNISLAIITSTRAQLFLSGKLNVDEPVEYSIQSNGDVSFEINDRTKELLRRFRTSLISAGYDPVTDTARVVVCPPLPVSVRIQLERTHAAPRRESVAEWVRSQRMRAVLHFPSLGEIARRHRRSQNTMKVLAGYLSPRRWHGLNGVRGRRTVTCSHQTVTRQPPCGHVWMQSFSACN